MDPRNQPCELACLTQIEEMLIACVNPILQVTHAHGGQYKCLGHTITFPQDISTIATSLPCLLPNLNILLESCFVVYNRLRNWKFHLVKTETQSIFFVYCQWYVCNLPGCSVYYSSSQCYTLLLINYFFFLCKI